MKKLFLTLFLLALSFFAIPQVFAQEELSVSPTVTPVPEVVYDMPYPGLLPDNPLYILKTTRDQIVGFLISDPSRKASFDLLQADKRFQAGIMLLQKDPSKQALAITTLSKGQNYYDQAIEKAQEAKRQKVETGDISGKIITSGKKQQEVLTDFINSHPNLKTDLEALRQRLNNLQKKASALGPRSDS